MRNRDNTKICGPSDYHVAYSTPYGEAIVGDSHEVLKQIEPNTVDLVMTSPPFALLREKDYGNQGQDSYIDWLCGFATDIYRVLKPTGSFVVDLGGAYQRGVPVRSLYNFRVLIKLVDEFGFFFGGRILLAQPQQTPLTDRMGQ